MLGLAKTARQSIALFLSLYYIQFINVRGLSILAGRRTLINKLPYKLNYVSGVHISFSQFSCLLIEKFFFYFLYLHLMSFICRNT